MKKQLKKSAPVVHQVDITLEDLFKGKQIKLKITKNVIFNKETNEKCTTEELENSWVQCTDCKGHGMKLEIRQIGPGMITQMQSPCSECMRTGYILKPEYKLDEDVELVTVDIKRGMDPNYQHMIRDVGHCYPGTLPGDIIITFKLKSHVQFNLRGLNLIMTREILLSEALCGTIFSIKQLDDSDIYIKTTKIIKPGMIESIKGKGMYDRFGLRGDLIIQFEIIFPDSLLIHQKKNLKKYLPKSDQYNISPPNDCELITM